MRTKNHSLMSADFVAAMRFYTQQCGACSCLYPGQTYRQPRLNKCVDIQYRPQI